MVDQIPVAVDNPEPERPVLNPHGSLVVDAIDQLRQELVSEIRQLGEARGEQPGSFNIWPNRLVTSQRIRANKLVISTVAAAPISVGLRIGESVERRLRLSDGTEEFDLTRIIQAGQAVDLIDLATGLVPTDVQLLDAWIVGFTE